MKRVLMIATVPSMIGQFNMSNIAILQEQGYEVHVACDFHDHSVWDEEKITAFQKELDRLKVRYHQIDFSRNPLDLKRDFESYRQMNELVKKESFNLIHCHTPVASVIGRIVAHQQHVKVIYTAHGFHFFKGAPLINWMLYYPIEKLCSRWTDVLITINKEDYALATKKMRAKQIVYIPGIGIDTKKFGEATEETRRTIKMCIRKELNIPEDAFVLLSVGEVNQNKNHRVVIEATAKLKNENIYYVVCGRGALIEVHKQLAQTLGIADRVILTGYRSDVADLYKAADAFAFPSFREGLSVALMEAMSSGLPCVVSNIRGNVDLVEYGVAGYVVENTAEAFAQAVQKLISMPQECERMGLSAKEKVKLFDVETVEVLMKKLYCENKS